MTCHFASTPCPSTSFAPEPTPNGHTLPDVRLEYRHLEVLVAIDEAGSLTAAAKVLNTNQPHVSRQLRRIEDFLGAPVFHRNVDGVRPTASGMGVLAQARRALSAAENFGTPRPQATTTIRILHSRIIASSLVGALQKEFPDVVPELGVAEPAEAYRQLNAGHADVYLGIRLPHIVWPQIGALSLQRIVSDPLRLLLPASHDLADREEVDLTDLSRGDWICTAMPDSREMTVGECRSVGGFEPRVRFQVHDSEHMRILLRDGLGVCFASSTWRASADLCLLPYGGSSTAHWIMVSAPGRVAPQLSATLAELVRARFEKITSPDGVSDAGGYA